MYWLKRNRRKVGLALAGMLLLLVLMVWIPVSAADAHEEISGLAGPGTVTVQVTPTEDATVTALNKEKLQHENDWWWNYAATILSSFLSTLVIVGGGIFALIRWLDDRQKERKRQDEEHQANLQRQEKERFESLSSVIAGLGDEKEGIRVGAAIMLRTIFLSPGYEQFYTQIFDLAVAHLRLPGTTHTPADPTPPQPSTTLSQALITVFKEAFPRARDRLREQEGQFRPESLDATGIQLDNAYLREADLKHAWMRHASMQNVDLRWADLSKANLREADLREAYPREADLSWANLRLADLRGAWFGNANLSNANLREARLEGTSLNETDLSNADLRRADLRRADLRRADLRRAYLTGADLSDANLTGADLSGADLGEANVDPSRVALSNLFEDFLSGKGTQLHGADLRGANLEEANIEEALSLKGTDLRGVKGLTKEQLAACKAKGAIIDEDSAVSTSEAAVSTSSPSQGNDTPVLSPTFAQEGGPTPDTGSSSATTSKPDPES